MYANREFLSCGALCARLVPGPQWGHMPEAASSLSRVLGRHFSQRGHSAVLPAKRRIVMGTTVPADRRESFWRTIARMLEAFGDAPDITEATLLAERVSKLEKEVAKLKEQRPT
jgi:hypothetical protein